MAYLVGVQQSLGDLEQGESALVPVAVGSYRVESLAPDTEVLKVSLPVNAYPEILASRNLRSKA